MDSFVFNLSGGLRQETLKGVDYLVADATLIVPGVLNGSRGPLLYPADEVGKNVEAWNGIPLLVNHPPSGQVGKDAVANQGIGYVADTRFVSEKLRAALWFNIARTKKLEPQLFDAVSASQAVEISTGLGMDTEQAAEGAVFNDPIDGQQAYTHTVSNLRPDHLAVLTNALGACSVRDGCGVNNELSHTDIRESLRLDLEARFGPETTWVEELFDRKVIFSNDGQLLQLPFMKNKDTVTLSDDAAIAVQRITSFKALNTGDLDMPPLTAKQKTTIVNELIENKCCWEEEHRDELMGMSDVLLDQTKVTADKQTQNEELLAAAEAGFDDDRDSITFNLEKKAWERVIKPEEKPVENRSGTEKLTEEQFMAMAPDSLLDTLNYAKDAKQAARQRLIDVIVANVSDDAKPAYIAAFGARPLAELELAASHSPKAGSFSHGPNHYGGQPPADLAPTTNEIPQDDQMLPPDMDWSADSELVNA